MQIGEDGKVSEKVNLYHSRITSKVEKNYDAKRLELIHIIH